MSVYGGVLRVSGLGLTSGAMRKVGLLLMGSTPIANGCVDAFTPPKAQPPSSTSVAWKSTCPKWSGRSSKKSLPNASISGSTCFNVQGSGLRVEGVGCGV